jgi:hypothetical protein
MSQIIDPQEDIVFFHRVEGYKNVDICGEGDLPCRTSQPGLIPALSNVFAPLLLLDWMIGMAVDTNDPNRSGRTRRLILQ